MNQLGIKYYFTGQVDKKTAYQELKRSLNLQDESFAYVADDFLICPLSNKSASNCSR